MTAKHLVFGDELTDMSQRVELNRRAGVSHAVVAGVPVVAHDAGDHGYVDLVMRNNTELVAAVTEAGDGVSALVTIPTGVPDASLDELRRWHDSPSVAGVIAFSHANPVPLDHPDLLPVWSFVGERGWPVLVHPALEAPPSEFMPWASGPAWQLRSGTRSRSLA